MPSPLRRPPRVSGERDLRIGRGPVARMHLAWLDLLLPPLLRVCILLEIADAVALSSRPLVASAKAKARAWHGGQRAGAADLLVHAAAPPRPSMQGSDTEARQTARLALRLPVPLGGGFLLLVLGAVPNAAGRGVKDLVLGGWGDYSLSSMGTSLPLPSLPDSALRALEGRARGATRRSTVTFRASGQGRH